MNINKKHKQPGFGNTRSDIGTLLGELWYYEPE